NSARNCKDFSSVRRVSLTSEKSTFDKEWVRNVLRPREPGRLCSEHGATEGGGHPGVTKTCCESDWPSASTGSEKNWGSPTVLKAAGATRSGRVGWNPV